MLQECNLSRSGMQIFMLRNAPKSCIRFRKFIFLSAVAALAVSLSQRQNGKSCDGSEEERARSLAQKQRRQSVNAASTL